MIGLLFYPEYLFLNSKPTPGSIANDLINQIRFKNCDYIMKYVTSEAISSDGSAARNSNIDWNDFNYPICLKLYHYNPEENPPQHRIRIALLRINHTFIILATFLNIITNIIGVAQKFMSIYVGFRMEASDWELVSFCFSSGSPCHSSSSSSPITSS